MTRAESTFTQHATFSFEYDDERRARLVARSIRVEVDEIEDERSRAQVSRSGSTVEVRIDAADLIALRAGINTWTRLTSVSESVAQSGAGRARSER